MSLSKIFKDGMGDAIDKQSLEAVLEEQSRMDFSKFMKRVKEYMSRNQIDFNSVGMSQNEMRQAYENGKYPSDFVKSYVKNQK